MQNGVFSSKTASHICIAGASGYAGSACFDVFHAEGWTVTGFSRHGGTTPNGLSVMACPDLDAFYGLLRLRCPDVLLIAAGIAELDVCEQNPILSQGANVEVMSEWIDTVRLVCPATKIVLLSSIYVFGEQCPPEGFCESDVPQPMSVYGRHKLLAEQRLQASGLRHLVVRLPWLVGNIAHLDDPIRHIWNKVQRGEFEVDGGLRFPTDVLWVAKSIAYFIRAGVDGVVHLGAAEPRSRFDLMAALLIQSGMDPGVLQLHKLLLIQQESGRRAPRPKYLKLSTCRPELQLLPACPHWHRLVERYVDYLNNRTHYP